MADGMGWHLGPMAPWDSETTGVDVEQDRIVTACVALLRPATPKWDLKVKSWLINPGVDIPDEATQVHGITSAYAKEHGEQPAPALNLIADELALAMQAHIPLVGQNLAYDNTIVDRELRRHGLPTVEERLGRPVGPCIDVFVLDKFVQPYRKGGRKLVDLCAHYGVRIDGAHDSTFDALAAARIAYVIGQRSQMSAGTLHGLYARERNPEEIVRAFQALGRMSLTQLHEAQVGWRAQQCASLRAYFDSKGTPHDGVDGSWPLKPYQPQEAMPV